MGERTAEADWFMSQLLALEPGTQNGGIYAYKAGYHNTRDNLWNHVVMQGNTATYPWRNDYSIRHWADKQGPGDKAAGFDWTFPSAQAGNYSRIRLYMTRIKAAFDARDERLQWWREALGQQDSDSDPEGFDFTTWTTRTPDDSHVWHVHLSILRAYVSSMYAYRCMLSVLRGETLAQWHASNAVTTTQEEPRKQMLIIATNIPGTNRAYVGDGIYRRWLKDWDTAVPNLTAAGAVQRSLWPGATATRTVEQAQDLVWETIGRIDVTDVSAFPAPGQFTEAQLQMLGETLAGSLAGNPALVSAIATAVADEDHRRSAE